MPEKLDGGDRMMREKKFRIWDIETKQFFYWDILQAPPTCLTAKYIREQTQDYIGLRDKHSKEIYEWDLKGPVVRRQICKSSKKLYGWKCPGFIGRVELFAQGASAAHRSKETKRKNYERD